MDDDDRPDVRAYLETMVGKRDTVALLVVSRWKAAAVVQEIQRVETWRDRSRSGGSMRSTATGMTCTAR